MGERRLRYACLDRCRTDIYQDTNSNCCNCTDYCASETDHDYLLSVDADIYSKLDECSGDKQKYLLDPWESNPRGRRTSIDVRWNSSRPPEVLAKGSDASS